MSSPLRVVLADREGAARRALAGLLAGLDGVVLADVAGDLTELAAALANGRPDMLLIDDRLLDGAHPLPGAAGLRVVVLGVDDDPAFAERARRLGAEAWIAKERADELLTALLAPRASVVSRNRARTRPDDAPLARP